MLVVSKVTLDIITVAAFGYNVNSLHNPNNELAEAYEELISLQNGEVSGQRPASSDSFQVQTLRDSL